MSRKRDSNTLAFPDKPPEIAHNCASHICNRIPHSPPLCQPHYR